MQLPDAKNEKVSGVEPILILAVPPRTGRQGRPSSVRQPVTATACDNLAKAVCAQAKDVAEDLFSDVMHRFPPMPLFQAFTVLYPHTWTDMDTVAPTSEQFEQCLDDIKERYYCNKDTCEDMLNEELLDQHARACQTLAPEFVAKAVEAAKDAHISEMTAYWRVLSAKPHVRAGISEYFKLVEIAMAMVPGTVEDDRRFSAMDFVKNKRRNCHES